MNEGDELLAAAIDDAFLGALIEDDPEDLYDNAPCAYLSTLPDGTIAKANATFLTWTGFTREELVGRRRFQDLLAPGDRIFHETHYAPALRIQGQVREIAVELVGSSGARLPVLVNSVLKRDADGNPVAIRTAIFDATERRSYERELLEARRHAEASEARATALARTLQSTFLPHEIPEVPGLDIAGAYRPAGDGSEVGGDFYDVFDTGRDRWGVVLGDVCGKGAAAAVLTSLARHTVRAESLRTSEPAAVLGRLHDAFVRYHPEQFCTAVLLFLQPEPGGRGTRVTMSAGGHHLPLRVRPDGRVDTIGLAGTIVGLVPTPSLFDTTAVLEAGDLLVLFTDGVTEGRRGSEFFDDDRLLAAIDGARTGDAAEVAAAVVAASVDFQGGSTRDDIAVVVLRALA